MNAFAVINERKFFLFLLLALGIFVSFFKYNDLHLKAAGAWQLDLVKYEERARFDEWKGAISQGQDIFATDMYQDKHALMQDMALYGYSNIPAYFFHKTFGLKGSALWLAQRLFMTLLGLALIFLFFLIADLCYGPIAGFLSGLFCAFSPHIWIAYNFDGTLARGYNLFFSVFTVFSFLLFCKTQKKRWILLSGLLMGANFLFFHIGSFAVPAILFIYAASRSFYEKKGTYITSALSILGIAIATSLVIHILHSWYFHLSAVSPLAWLQTYLSRGEGAIASHSPEGIVLFDIKRLFFNLLDHWRGLFFDGVTSDWHYILSPPGVPYVYNYLIFPLFLVKLATLTKNRTKYDNFFLVWFLFFFIVYSFVIVVRQKNILWEIPAIYILSASAVPDIARFLHKKMARFSEARFRNAIAGILCLSTVFCGGWWIFHGLPQKNFFDGSATLGTYQIYRHIVSQGLTSETAVIFTIPEASVGSMMLHLFLDDKAQVVCLSRNGVPSPPLEGDWEKSEAALRQIYDKIFYCFTYHDNHKGRIYVTDEPYRAIFEKFHPQTQPFLAKGLDGSIVWRVYELGSEPPVPVALPADKPAVLTAEPANNITKVNFGEKVIATSFKILAKSFVTFINLESFKEKNAAKMQKMSDDKFKKKYASVHDFLKELPQDIKDEYGIAQEMTRQKAIENIQVMDKDKMYRLIDEVPDSFIARKFNAYVDEQKMVLEKSNIVSQIKGVWEKITRGAFEKKP